MDNNTRRVARATDEGLDDSGGPWVAICDTHGSIVNTITRAQARSSNTIDFCDGCRPESAAAVEESPVEVVELASETGDLPATEPGDSRLDRLVRDLHVVQVNDRDLYRLDVLAEIVAQAQLMMDREVDRAREVERTWSQIAAATGMRSKQSAAMRWGKKRPAATEQTEAMF